MIRHKKFATYHSPQGIFATGNFATRFIRHIYFRHMFYSRKIRHIFSKWPDIFVKMDNISQFFFANFCIVIRKLNLTQPNLTQPNLTLPNQD